MTLKFKYMQNFSISLKIYYSVLTDAVFDLWGLILALFSENCKGHCNSIARNDQKSYDPTHFMGMKCEEKIPSFL